jgi:hypothetical protein
MVGIKVLILVSFVASCFAFAPVSNKVMSSSLCAKQKAKSSGDFSEALGAQAPLGFWDPLGLLKDADQERFDRLRYVETKHGRISMLAILGHLVTTAGVRLPGNIAYGVPFASVKNGLAAFDTIPAAGTAQIIAFIGLIELGFGYRQEVILFSIIFSLLFLSATLCTCSSLPLILFDLNNQLVT